jgi:hypothetical protein
MIVPPLHLDEFSLVYYLGRIVEQEGGNSMSLKVIGAGFGRTGTLSLKVALEQLGFGPCYHMVEVMSRPNHIAMWHRLAFGKSIDWDELFDGFAATVDWPGCTYWRELADHYPDAKVLLSVRPAENWWRSMNDTIYPAMKMMALRADAPPEAKQQQEMVRRQVLEDTFHDRFEDKAFALEVFQKHIDEVRAAIEPKRLLVFDVAESWGPLCRFLGVPEPAEPFPRLNDTPAFQAMIKMMSGQST